MEGCLLCEGALTDPTNIAVPLRAWWPDMVTCTNPECIAFGIYVAADPDALERMAYSEADRLEPKFAYSVDADNRWYVSTIYRKSSAIDYADRWYYETHGYLTGEDGARRWIYEATAGGARRALHVHAVLSKRASRLYSSLVPA